MTIGILPIVNSPRTGQYKVVYVHDNGTVTITLKGNVQQTVKYPKEY
jgi:hypothetical protein